MDAIDQAILSTGNSIEICNATTSPNSHVDIPLKDLAPIVVEILRRDLMNPKETDLILDAALGRCTGRNKGSEMASIEAATRRLLGGKPPVHRNWCTMAWFLQYVQTSEQT